MHELSITQSILSLVLERAAAVRATRVTRVYLKVGEWSTIEPDCVRFYFGILAKGTPAEGADVAFESVPVAYACEGCGLEYVPDVGTLSCPTCSSRKGKLVRGRELSVESIEVENADPGSSESPGGE